MALVEVQDVALKPPLEQVFMGYVKVADGDPPQEVEVKNELTVTEVAA
jgi:hypothetical protein